MLFLIWKPKGTIYGTLILSLGILIGFEIYILNKKVEGENDFFGRFKTNFGRAESLFLLLTTLILCYLFASKRTLIQAAIETYAMATRFIRRNYYILLVPICSSIGMMVILLIFDYFYNRATPTTDYATNKLKSFIQIPTIFFF